MCVKECEETQVMCITEESHDWTHDWLAIGKSPKWHTCEACRELKGHNNWSTTGQKVQSGLEVILRLKLAIVPFGRPSRQNALFGWKLTLHIPHIPYYKYPYTHEMYGAKKEAYWEKNPKKGFYNTHLIRERATYS